MLFRSEEVVIAPIGFLSDHMEVIYDLDKEAAEKASELGLRLSRAATVGNHPRLVTMIRELIEERLNPDTIRQTCGSLPTSHDECPADCCVVSPRRPPAT